MILIDRNCASLQKHVLKGNDIIASGSDVNNVSGILLRYCFQSLKKQEIFEVRAGEK